MVPGHIMIRQVHYALLGASWMSLYSNAGGVSSYPVNMCVSPVKYIAVLTKIKCKNNVLHIVTIDRLCLRT